MNTTTTRTTAPSARWVSVPDAQGRPCLEMRWSVPGAPLPASLPAAA